MLLLGIISISKMFLCEFTLLEQRSSCANYLPFDSFIIEVVHPVFIQGKCCTDKGI